VKHVLVLAPGDTVQLCWQQEGQPTITEDRKIPGPPTEPTTDPKDCTHPDFYANVGVARLEDSGKFLAEVRVKCSACGMPFRFLGVPAGVAFYEPRTSIDDLELRAPIEPEMEKQLHGSASFEMPKIPVRH
jgi:hypothetical protein